jgi:prepilin peptidase CpaA
MTADVYVLVATMLVFTAGAAVFDWRTKRLPNWLTVSMAALGLAFHVVVGAITAGASGAAAHALSSLGGFAIGFGLLFVLWLVGSSGGGDVKYTAALGAWLGPTLTFYVILLSVLFIAAGAIGILAFEAMRLGFGRAKARYVTSGGKAKAFRNEDDRQAAMAKRRLMPWAVPAAFATWLVLGWQVLQAVQGGGQ